MTRTRLGLAALVALHFSLAAHLAWRQTPTLDEVAHLPAGVSYVERGTFKMFRLSPPLGRLLPALAALPSSFPRVYDRSWSLDPASHWAFAAEWVYASDAEPEPYLAAVGRARLVVCAWSALTLLVAFFWARWWFGETAGWLAAGLWAVAPNLIAHASLLTTDLAAASMTLVAAFCFARWLDAPSRGRAALAGVALGAAQLIKLTQLWLLPAFAVWAAIHWRRRAALPRWQVCALPLVVLLTVDVGYGFEGVGVPLGELRFVSDALTRPRGGEEVEPSSHPVYRKILEKRVNRFRGSLLGGLPCPLPRHYVEGWDEQKLEADGGSAALTSKRRAYPMYLRGELRLGGHGWWYYYLYALLVKLPVGTLLLILLAVGGVLYDAGWGSPQRIGRTVCVGALAFVPIALVSLMVDAAIGVRHVLGALPFLLLFAASAASDHRPRMVRQAALALLALNVLGLAWTHPHELAHFNAPAGGSANGRAHLADSNLDWGQDLRALARWVRANPEWKDVRLAYMGQIPPEWEGLEHRLAPRDLREVSSAAWLPHERADDPTSFGPQPGKFAVSVNFALGLPFHTPCPRALLRGLPREQLAVLLKPPPYLRVPAGVYAYFQDLTPIQVPAIGYSILLFDVTLEQANALRREMRLPELR